MTDEMVLLSGGKRITLTEIQLGTSADLYQTEILYKVTEKLAAHITTSPHLQPVLMNLLSLKSSRAKQIAALLSFIENNKKNILEVTVKKDIAKILAGLPQYRFTYKTIPGDSPNLIERKHSIQALLKAILHRAFRLLRHTPPSDSTLIRSWVEVTIKMFPEIYKSAELRIFPFALGLKRQIQFIKYCRENQLMHSLDGLPYSIPRAFINIFRNASRPLKMAEFEHLANHKYANEVLSWKPKKVYTSDEFEVGAISLHRTLLDNGVAVINCAHGVGWYCPYVAYKEFWAITLEQGEFYSLRYPKINVKLRGGQNSKLPFSKEDCIKNPPALVMIHQNFEDHSLHAEDAAQIRIARLLESASRSYDLPFLIKMHPNTTDDNKKKVASILGGKPLVGWADLKQHRPIFFLINSTTFFELREIAPILVYEADSFAPETYFGSSYNSFTEGNCLEKINQLLAVDEWESAISSQRPKEQ